MELTKRRGLEDVTVITRESALLHVPWVGWSKSSYRLSYVQHRPASPRSDGQGKNGKERRNLITDVMRLKPSSSEECRDD